MSRVFGGAAALVVAIGMVLVINTTGALAYQSGTIGYDISYPQCGSSFLTTSGPPRTAPPTATLAAPTWRNRTAVSTSVAPQVPTPAARSKPLPQGVSWRSSRTFGIIGVDHGRPFDSNPGNPCLADQYSRTPNPALYVNTGYDPSYTDTSHTLADCTTKSGSVSGSDAQKAAWAVGCSEAEKDFAYVTSQGITNTGGWWLDVETANSWCSPTGPNCTDLTLNQYSIQGLIDTLIAGNASAVGIYSNKRMWSIIVGANPVHGQTADWYASGTNTAQAAAPFCASSNSFTGDPVKLAQYVNGIDYDYAC